MLSCGPCVVPGEGHTGAVAGDAHCQLYTASYRLCTTVAVPAVEHLGTTAPVQRALCEACAVALLACRTAGVATTTTTNSEPGSCMSFVCVPQVLVTSLTSCTALPHTTAAAAAAIRAGTGWLCLGVALGRGVGLPPAAPLMAPWWCMGGWDTTMSAVGTYSCCTCMTELVVHM
jgi:hypothetical protein